MSYRSTKVQRADNRRKRDILRDLKNVPCMDCGDRFPPECMDFDHRDSSEKKLNIAKVSHHGLKALLDETEKCDIVCANCHRIRTRKRNQYGSVELKHSK